MSVESNTPIDPRVQIELEKLNSATDSINKYELELEESKKEFKELLKESIERIKHSAKKLGNSISTAKPYYEARLYATQLSKETQTAATNYDKAKSILAASKEMVYLAEQGLCEKTVLDTACQEMLTHATTKVNDSQIQCIEKKNIYKICELKQEVANTRVAKLQAQLKSAIKASRPYYETRANYNGKLKEHKEKINALESRISEAKLSYNEALKNLEQISDEIHRMRQERVACREMANSQTDEDDFLGESRANRIDTTDEYYNFPPKLTTKSSPIRVKSMNQNECPHLLREIELKTAASNYMSTVPTPTNQQPLDPSTVDIEQWTEIRLSHSNSSSSQHSAMVTPTLESDTTSLSSDSFASSDSDRNRPHKIVKVTRKVIKDNVERGDDASTADDKKKSEGLTGWISKSKVQSSNSRRQSFDMLIGDTGDRVKDVFAQGIQRIGKTLERRNSESEIAVTESSNDFFSFSRSDKDGLSDEQVENLLLDQECAEMIQNQGLNISKMN